MVQTRPAIGDRSVNRRGESKSSRHPLAVLNLPFILLIRLYQILLSPFLGGHCRFQPTCSNYALDCYLTHHALRATWLTIWRVGRCHPFGSGGHDPSPPYDRSK